MNRFSGINLLRDDDPVLNRPMFARFANGGEVQAEETQIEDESDLGFTDPSIEVGPPPGTEAVKETIGLDQQPEVNQQMEQQMEQPIPEATSVPSAQSQTQSQMYSNKDKVMLALLPIAAELLNATTPKGQSNFSSFLSAAGRGLATIPRTLMGINQLQAKETTSKAVLPKDYMFTKQFKFNNVLYQPQARVQLTPEQVNAITQIDATAVVPYKEETQDKKQSKKIDVLEDFTMDGVTYKKGADRQVPESIVLKQLKINPNVFGDIPTEGGKPKTESRGYVLVTDEDGTTNDNAYPLVSEGDKFYVLKGGEKLDYNDLQDQNRITNLFTASQYDKARGKIPDQQFFKMEDELEKEKQTIMTFNDMYEVLSRGGETFEAKKNALMARVKIYTGRVNQLTDAERAKLEQEGSLRRLIGQSRLALFGPGVLTEFEQELAKLALVGDENFPVKEVYGALLRKAARGPLSKYDKLKKRVQNQRRKRAAPGEKIDPFFDYNTLPLLRDAKVDLPDTEDDGRDIGD